eukprot:m.143067 g.143067  ORF g.143067 m.143067 type:complete len:55 (-) comp16171_c0_seq25:672-836(-)
MSLSVFSSRCMTSADAGRDAVVDAGLLTTVKPKLSECNSQYHNVAHDSKKNRNS